IHITNIEKDEPCKGCLEGKFRAKLNKTNSNPIKKKWEILEKISSDICGPLSQLTYDKYRYFITFLDINIRFLELELIKTKTEAKEAFEKYKAKYENLSNKRIKIFNTDN